MYSRHLVEHYRYHHHHTFKHYVGTVFVYLIRSIPTLSISLVVLAMGIELCKQGIGQLLCITVGTPLVLGGFGVLLGTCINMATVIGSPRANALMCYWCKHRKPI